MRALIVWEMAAVDADVLFCLDCAYVPECSDTVEGEEMLI